MFSLAEVLSSKVGRYGSGARGVGRGLAEGSFSGWVLPTSGSHGCHTISSKSDHRQLLNCAGQDAPQRFDVYGTTFRVLRYLILHRRRLADGPRIANAAMAVKKPWNVRSSQSRDRCVYSIPDSCFKQAKDTDVAIYSNNHTDSCAYGAALEPPCSRPTIFS